MNLLKDVKVTLVQVSAAAGTTALNSSVLDMQGFEGVMYLAVLNDVTSGSILTLTAKRNTANSTSSPTPTSGPAATYTSASSSDADDKLLIVDDFRPQERYSFANLTRTTQNAVIGGIIAIQYKAGKRPTTQDATTVLASTFGLGA
jgi:hypothetical protein